MRALLLLTLLGALGARFDAGGKVAASPADEAPAPSAAPEPLRSSCAELWERPGPHLGRAVALRVQFRSWIPSWNPFLTRFGSGQYRAFDAWGEEQLLWLPEDFEFPQARFFVRRGSAAEWALERAQRFAGFELIGAVRSVFGDAPWIEVLGVRPSVRAVTEGSILHASRALAAIERESWERALDELERALAAPLPEPARDELERLRALASAEADRARLDKGLPARR